MENCAWSVIEGLTDSHCTRDGARMAMDWRPIGNWCFFEQPETRKRHLSSRTSSCHGWREKSTPLWFRARTRNPGRSVSQNYLKLSENPVLCGSKVTKGSDCSRSLAIETIHPAPFIRHVFASDPDAQLSCGRGLPGPSLLLPGFLGSRI